MIRRILALAALVALAALTVQAGSGQGHTVGTNSVMVLPPRGLAAADAWAASTLYSQGDVVKHGASYFWCQTAGGGTNTASDAPAIDTDGRSSAGTNTWEFIKPGARKFGYVVNDSTNAVYLNDVTATTGAGIPLTSRGSVWNIPAGLMNSPIYAICGSAGNNVATFDR
jgi:hypothetical protein